MWKDFENKTEDINKSNHKLFYKILKNKRTRKQRRQSMSKARTKT